MLSKHEAQYPWVWYSISCYPSWPIVILDQIPRAMLFMPSILNQALTVKDKERTFLREVINCQVVALESPLDCKQIQPVHSKGDQSWDFSGRNDAEAETPVLWPPHAKSWLIGKDSDAGRDWGRGVGWGGSLEGGSRGRGHMYVYGWSMLMYGRNQHNIVIIFN